MNASFHPLIFIVNRQLIQHPPLQFRQRAYPTRYAVEYIRRLVERPKSFKIITVPLDHIASYIRFSFIANQLNITLGHFNLRTIDFSY